MNLVSLDLARFTADFNQRPFMVRHQLTDHPAFRIERLVDLARRLPAANVEYNAGDLPVTQDPRTTPRTGLSADETIRRIAECRSWMVLKRVEIDPEYKRLLDGCLDDIAPLVAGMRMRRAFIFVSSPGAVTPYHIDHEYNFLLQIAGHKQMALHDRGAVSEHELERFYRGEHRNLVLADRAGHHARVFELGPGDGVHVPVNAPHYVRNGDAVSVSFSITFRTPEGDRRSAVYVVNDRLRRLGLAPRAVGAVPLVDRTKYLGYSIYQRAQRRLGRG